MGRKPSFLWSYAECLGNQFKCKFCKRVFPGGVVRLRAHLAGIKGRGIQVCGKVLKDVRDDALLESNGANKKKSKTDTSSSNSDEPFSTISDTSCSSEVDTSLAKFFEMNSLPCCIVESPSFINLVNALTKSGPGYVPPNCSTLENQLIPSLRQEVEQYVSSARQSWEEIGCTLVSDMWLNDKENRSFVSIMACSGKRAMLLSTFEIPNNNITVAFLKEIVHRVVQDIGVENIVQYIVDDSECAKLFSKLLGRKCPHVFMTKCAVREVQSCFEELRQNVEWVRSTFEVAEFLVDFLCKDDSLSALMMKYTGGKELKHSFSYGMLESIFEVREELVKLVQSAEWLALGYDQGENGKKATEIIASEEFWKQGGEVQIILKPLFEILHLDDAADSGFGYIYGLMKLVEEAIAGLHTSNRVKYQKLWEIFESKKGDIVNETHKAAAYLNPSYMCNVTVQESAQMEEGINYILREVVAAADEVAFVEQATRYRQTLSNPSERLKIVAAKTFPPCQWWNAFGNEFPILKKYAIRILNQPCGSSSYNINLNAFQANLIKERGLVPDLHDLYVRVNLGWMEKSYADSATKRKSINFEEFSQHKPTNGSSDATLIEAATHSDEETSLVVTSNLFLQSKSLKLCFITIVASPLVTGQKVEGQEEYPIYVQLKDFTTGCVVQEGALSVLTLTISVFDGDFTNEASSDECRTREYFDNNDLSSNMIPLMTGDLKVILEQGEGMLGDFFFNFSSRHTRSGKFRLGIKTDTGDCEGIRIFEGISNAFYVDDIEVTRTQHPSACEMHIPKDSGSLSIVGLMEDLGGLAQQTFGDTSGSPGYWTDQLWNYNQLQGSSRSLTHAATRDDVLKPREEHSAEGDNVNQQDDGKENDGSVALEGFDSLNSSSCTVAGDLKSKSPAVTLFGVRVTSSVPESTGKTLEAQSPTDPSTTLQLSLAGDEFLEPTMGTDSTGRNNINPKEHLEKNDEPIAVSNRTNSVDSTTSAIPKGSISLKPESSAITFSGAQVASSSVGEATVGETDEVQSKTHPSRRLHSACQEDGQEIGERMTQADIEEILGLEQPAKSVNVLEISATANQQKDREELTEEGAGECTPPLKAESPGFLFGAKSKAETHDVQSKKCVLGVGQQIDEKLKKKILKTAAHIKGVESVSVDMQNKKLIVTGKYNCVDLIGKLEKVCPIQFLTIGNEEVDDKKNSSNELANKDHQYPYYMPPADIYQRASTCTMLDEFIEPTDEESKSSCVIC